MGYFPINYTPDFIWISQVLLLMAFLDSWIKLISHYVSLVSSNLCKFLSFLFINELITLKSPHHPFCRIGHRFIFSVSLNKVTFQWLYLSAFSLCLAFTLSFLKIKNTVGIQYLFQMYNIVVWKLYTFLNAHYCDCSYHLSTYKNITIELTIFAMLYFSSHD